MTASGPSFLTYVLAASLLIGFGAARAVWRRARKDYDSTRQAVKDLRKAKWQALWSAIKLGTFATVVGMLLFAWVVHDAKQHINETPVGEVSPAASKGTR